MFLFIIFLIINHDISSYVCICIYYRRPIHGYEVNEYADKIEAVDVGIDEFGLCDSPALESNVGGSRGLLCAQGFSEITYIHIHECDNFSVSRK